MTAQRPSKRSRIFLLEDVQKHNTPKDCWVVHNNKIYDVSQFLDDHPGGDDLILAWAGKDITAVMDDPVEHSHSDSAYSVLDEYVVGRLGTEETITDPNFEFKDDWHPEDTDNGKDWEKNQFLDLERPLIMQVWNADFSKAFYLQQVHQPRHLPRPARLFGPWYLEIFTMTSWYVVPLIWLPIAGYIFRQSIVQQTVERGLPLATALGRSGACFLVGNVIWTLLEYGLHRFLFHIDELLPDRPFFLMLHFLLHGIHHYIPMDRMRLVMPPLLFFALQTPFTRLAHVLFPNWMANGIIAGSFTFYVLYDVMHYALHHTKLPEYVKKQKSWHMEHHFASLSLLFLRCSPYLPLTPPPTDKEPNLGFGVTSPVWDRVFSTTFVSPGKVQPSGAANGAAVANGKK